MMLKVIPYAYANRIYSSRQIAKQLEENIYFMWLSGHQKPDFRTINRFRSGRMKEIIYETFFAIVDLLREEGLVKLEDYFLDGTKLEANANKYTFVWKGSTLKYDQKLDEKFRQIVQLSIEEVAQEDEEAERETYFQEKLDEIPITSEKIAETVKKIEERLGHEPKNKATTGKRSPPTKEKIRRTEENSRRATVSPRRIRMPPSCA